MRGRQFSRQRPDIPAIWWWCRAKSPFLSDNVMIVFLGLSAAFGDNKISIHWLVVLYHFLATFTIRLKLLPLTHASVHSSIIYCLRLRKSKSTKSSHPSESLSKTQSFPPLKIPTKLRRMRVKQVSFPPNFPIYLLLVFMRVGTPPR